MPIEQVLTNLLLNARDALENAPEKRLIIRTFAEDRQIILEVEDTAGGIPEGVLAHIFESFYTTKEEGQGTGLGLSISKTIVTEHEGTLNVESEPERGSIFRMALPIAQNDETKPA